eukprot:1203355-Rhodomonas_salina.1
MSRATVGRDPPTSKRNVEDSSGASFRPLLRRIPSRDTSSQTPPASPVHAASRHSGSLTETLTETHCGVSSFPAPHPARPASCA